MATFVDTLPLENALSFVLPYVNGCPPQTVIFHLRQAAIEFMRKTLAWQMQLDPVQSVVGQGVYAIPLPDDSRVVKILRYKLGTRYESSLLTPSQGRGYRDDDRGIEGIWSDDLTNFNVTPLPLKVEPMTLTVALRPDERALEIPENIYEQYIQCIAYGAISTISDIPRQSFTDAGVAAAKGSQFRDEIASVAARVSKGSSSASGRVRSYHY